MDCPACGNVLTLTVAGDITVNACERGCGGVWFDRGEIDKIDEPHEAAGEAILNLKRDDTVHVDVSGKRMCPKCETIPMMQHFFSVKRKVALEECPACGGFWLDAGELAVMRRLFNSEEERAKAAEEYFDDVFGDELAAHRAKNQEELDRSRRIARMFRFICPSYYIPGKQDWGAF